MVHYIYRANITKNESGRYVATFPDFGWGATDGPTVAECLASASDCLAEMIAHLISQDRDIPLPGLAREGECYVVAVVKG